MIPWDGGHIKSTRIYNGGSVVAHLLRRGQPYDTAVFHIKLYAHILFAPRVLRYLMNGCPRVSLSKEDLELWASAHIKVCFASR